MKDEQEQRIINQIKGWASGIIAFLFLLTSFIMNGFAKLGLKECEGVTIFLVFCGVLFGIIAVIVTGRR
jgi:hypothetical protein